LKYINLTSSLVVTAAFIMGCSSSSDNAGSELDPVQGPTERMVSYTVNQSNGQIVTITSRYLDDGNMLGQQFSLDGAVYLDTTFEHNTNNEFTRRSEDTNQDGIEDSYSTYEYNVHGLSRIYRHADGLINNVSVFNFEDGLAVTRDVYSIEKVPTADLVDLSTATRIQQHLMQYENRRISVLNIDEGADGRINTREDFSYNPNGTLSTSITTRLGTLDSSSTVFVYESGSCSMNANNSATSFFCISVKN